MILILIMILLLYIIIQKKRNSKASLYLTVVSFCVRIKLVSGSLITLEYFSMSCRRQGSSTPSAIISSHFTETMLAPSNWNEKFFSHSWIKEIDQTHVGLARAKEQIYGRRCSSKKTGSDYAKFRQLMLHVLEEFKRSINLDVSSA